MTVKFKPAWKKQLVHLMQNGWTLSEALKAAKIGRDKYNAEVFSDEEFRMDCEQAIDSRFVAGPTRRFG
jgi:hypothetical protein